MDGGAQICTLEDPHGECKPAVEQGDQVSSPDRQGESLLQSPRRLDVSSTDRHVRIMTTMDEPPKLDDPKPEVKKRTPSLYDELISSLPSPTHSTGGSTTVPVKACLVSTTEVPTEPLSCATPVLEYIAEDPNETDVPQDPGEPGITTENEAAVAQPSTRPKPQVISEGRFRVQYAYTRPPDDNTQLSVKPGDIVMVLRRDASGWTYGRREPGPHDRKSVPGWFPDALLGERIPEPGEVKPATPRSPKVVENDTSGFSSPRWSKGQADELQQCIAATQAVTAEIASRSSTAQRRSMGTSSPPQPHPTTLGPGEDEEAQLLICEKRLSNRACVRRKCLDDCYLSETRVKDAEKEVDEAERILKSLEVQERKCLMEVGCTFGRQRQHTDIKLKALTEKREAAAVRLEAERCRLQEDQKKVEAARQRLRVEQQAAKEALLAVSKQRERAKAAAVGLSRRSGSAPRCATAPRDDRTLLDRVERAMDHKGIVGGSDRSTRSRSRLGLRVRDVPPRTPHMSGPASQVGHTTPGRGRTGNLSNGPARPGTVSAPRRSAGSPELRGGISAAPARSSTGSSTGGGLRVRSPIQRPPGQVSPGRKTAGPATSVNANHEPVPVPQTASELGELLHRKQSTGRAASPSPTSMLPGPTAGHLNGATEERDLTQALEVLQTVESLRTKWEAVPGHLRQPLMERFTDLRGLLQEPVEAG